MLSLRQRAGGGSQPPEGLLALLASDVVGTLGASFDQQVTQIDNESVTNCDVRLIAQLVFQIQKQILRVLEARNLNEFKRRRDDYFQNYARAVRALSDTMRNFMPREKFIELSNKALEFFTEDFERERGKSFTEELINQTQFTLWTLRRLTSLGSAIDAAGQPPEESRGADAELNKDYRMHSVWSQYHVEITLAAMSLHKTITTEIQHEICEGLRAAVNAYAVGEEALALRTPAMEAPESVVANTVWDDEDEELLASSMRDLDASPDL
jgi:hypothetical protein